MSRAAEGTFVCASMADHVFLLVREVWVLPFLCIKCIRSSSDDNRYDSLFETVHVVVPRLKLLFLAADVSTDVLLWRLLRCGDHSVC